MSNIGRRDENDAGVGCLAWALVILFALPMYGLYRMLTGKTTDDKIVGFLILIVGIIIWIVLYSTGD